MDESLRSIYRIIDANLNRAREGARVLEEYARFSINDAALSESIKEIRHRLATIAEGIGPTLLAAARDTAGDVGTAITNQREMKRASSAEVLSANCKRLQEALRAIEEYSKVVNADNAALAEALRYQSYTLEQQLLCDPDRRMVDTSPVMLIITKSLCKQTYEEVLTQAYAAGVRCFQLREKGVDRDAIRATLEQGLRTLRKCGQCVIIINDHVILAGELMADGVHLGQDDESPQAAREALGPWAIIGQSTHILEEVAAAPDCVNYFGAGAMFDTSTKSVEHRGGPSFGRDASLATTRPVFCIGGIDWRGAEELREIGVSRIAVCGAICGADDPGKAARELLKIFSATEPTREEHHV